MHHGCWLLARASPPGHAAWHAQLPTRTRADPPPLPVRPAPQAWQRICDASRREFQKIYDRLDVTLQGGSLVAAC